MLIFKLKKILLDRGFDPDTLSECFSIKDRLVGGPVLDFWNEAVLGNRPTQREIDEADIEVYTQRAEFKLKLPDPVDYMVALFLARNGDSSLLIELDNTIQEALTEHPKATIRSIATRKRSREAASVGLTDKI